jgi:hypothetical protein
MSESITLRLALASCATLGGIAMVLARSADSRAPSVR